MEFSIDDFQKANNNIKRIKLDKHDEKFWRDFESSNMLGERERCRIIRSRATK